MSLGYDDIAVFLGVAREGSFVSAAKKLRMPVSTVSRRVTALEERLGVQLLRRTTRTVQLTDDGRAFADRCGAAVAEIESATDTLSASGDRLRGSLRVTAPFFACSEMFGPYLLEFAAMHPELVLDLRLTNTVPDLIEDGIDLAFQFGPLPDSPNKARKLWPVRYILCASRSFMSRHPEATDLDHPVQLANIACVVAPSLATWSFERDGETIDFTPRIRGATIEDLALAAIAVQRGLGIGFMPESLFLREQADLQALTLGGWSPRARDLFAIYPATRQLSPKVRAAIDHAVAGLGWYKDQPARSPSNRVVS